MLIWLLTALLLGADHRGAEKAEQRFADEEARVRLILESRPEASMGLIKRCLHIHNPAALANPLVLPHAIQFSA